MTDRSKPGQVALVLGATGGIGGEVALQLRAAGWTVRALHRRADQQRQAAVQASGAQSSRDRGGIEWLQGDAMNRADVVAAAAGAKLIVHAVNPPGYRRWNELVLPMIDNTIAAARASGARIVLPGTVYNFGPEVFADIRETSPQRPRTTKGAIRVAMEARLRAAAAAGVRCSSFARGISSGRARPTTGSPRAWSGPASR
jgi:nucleoside-diphosphate-sugar epimerase